MKRQILLLVLMLLPLVANAYDACINRIYYNFSGNEATVTSGSYYDSVVIPASVTYNGRTYSVTNIGYQAFYRCNDLTSVTIPNSVTSIGDQAFSYCSSLTSIIIPNSVTSIGIAAFYGCRSLSSITIPNSVIFIGNGAFYSTAWYNNKPDGLIYAGKVAYEYKGTMPSDTHITIKEGTIGITENAFSGCSGLTSITIPNSVTNIGKSAFRNCSSLTSVIIPDSVTSIGEAIFSGCSGLTSITIPNSVTSIGYQTFSGCTGLTSIIIPNSVTKISNEAFSGCRSLTSITIPEGVTSIGNGAFSNCTGLKSVTINSNAIVSANRNYDSSLSTIFDTQVTQYEIGNSVNVIGNYAFYGCSGLIIVTIPESVTSIGRYAFSYCRSLTSVTIPESVTNIDEYVFRCCSSLTSVTIPNSVTSISRYAFDDTNIKKLIWLTNTPPSGYENVRGAINYVSNEQYTSLQNTVVYPFLSSIFEAEGIKYVPVNPSERTCDAIDCVYDETAANVSIPSVVSFRGISMNVLDVKPYLCYNNKFIKTLSYEKTGNIVEYAFYGCTGITSAVCNNSGDIAEYAFSGCTNMTSLSLGEDVSAIGNYAFQNCSSLQSVNIPNATATLGDYAFSNCSSLTDIQLGQNVQSIGTYAFKGCSTLPAITIPKSVNTIGDYAFQGCTAIKDFIIDNRENELSLGRNGSSPLFADCPLDSVYIGGNITYSTSSSNGYSPFYRNKTLRTVVITDRETEISPYEFYGCTNLQSFKIGDGVTSFGDWAFSGCTSLKILSFGSQLQSIGKEAFSDCTSVTKIVSKAATPPSCGDQALDDINKWDCTLVVPEGSLTAYQGAEQWKQFFFIEEGTGSGDEPDPEVKKCAKPTISYANGKLTFDSETEGAICHSTIKDTDIRSYSDNEVQLGVTYNITVYATKAGFENSDIATATLCWVDVEPAAEGLTDEDAVAEVKALPVLIQTQGGTIIVQGAVEGTNVSVYSVNGMLQGSAIADEGVAILNTSLQPGSVAVVKIGEKSVKVLMK